jgi:cytoskeleton protein RodZ
VLEIGSTLREVRIRRGVELAQVDADTHIRRKYLEALEGDRFDVLPGEAYVRGFLRTYADYLGLDSDLFVDEYNARFAPPEEPLPQLVGRRRAQHRLPARGTVVVLLAIALVAVVAWRFDSSEPREPAPAGVPPARLPPPPTPVRVSAPPRRENRAATLVLTAARGPCWLSVHLGSVAGKLLREGMIEQGQSLRFAGRRFWIRLGAPQNLEARLNGAPARLPDDTANIVVSTAGLRTVDFG